MIVPFSDMTTGCATTLLLPSLPLSSTVAGMTRYLPSPWGHVRLLLSLSYTIQVSLSRLFPSCFWSTYLHFSPIPPHHFPHVVLYVSPRHILASVQSSVCDLFNCLRHSRCSSGVLVYDSVVTCHRTSTVPFLFCSLQSVFLAAS